MVRLNRMDGYIRVSRVGGREGPSYISPSVQRDAIKRWAAYHNVTIDTWHTDEDHSGGTQQRPGLREAMRRIESHATDGIVCWRLNRFARNVTGAIGDIERIKAAKAHFVCVVENIDTTGPLGEFLLVILLAVAKLERDNVTEAWKIAQERAVNRGAKVSIAPYGYRRGSDGVLEIHPIEGPHISKAYDLAAVHGVAAAAKHLAAECPERIWTTATTRRALARRVYLGEVSVGGTVNPHAHEALVSAAIWEAAQHEPRRLRAASANYPLSGLARCGHCGSAMIAGSSKRGQRSYRCSRSQTPRHSDRCPNPALISADRLEGHVREQVRPLIADIALSQGQTDETTLAERAMVEAEAELQAFAADLTLRKALGSSYHEYLQSRVDAVEEARAKLRAATARSQTRHMLSHRDVLDSNDPRLFRELLRGILASIVVHRGRDLPLEDRVAFEPLQL